MATISAFFMLLAARRMLYVSAENPCHSHYFDFPPVRNVLAALEVNYQTTDGCRFSTMRKGKRFLKRFKFAASGPLICKVFRRCNCPGGTHEKLMTKDTDGGIRGTASLKKSQAYPKALGAATVPAWTESLTWMFLQVARPNKKPVKKTIPQTSKPRAKPVKKTLVKPTKPSSRPAKK